MLKSDRDWIDNASYAELLTVWRRAPLDRDHRLVGDTGEHFKNVMFEKKKLVDHVKISKEVGWE